MSPDAITPLLLQYRYLIVVPLAFLEGPFVAFFCGTLAAAGYLNPAILMIIFVLRDAIVDLGYYSVGVFASKTQFVHKLLNRIGVTPEHLGRAKSLWHGHPWKTIAMGKLSYGIAPAFFVVAGMIRMPLPKFVTLNVIAATFLYGVFLIAGYFFGNALGGSIGALLNNIQLVAGVIITVVVVFHGIRFYFKQRLLKAEQESPDER